MTRGLGRTQELDDLRDAPRLEQVLDHGAVFARKLDHLLSRGIRVGDRVGLDPQGAADVRLAATKAGAVLAAESKRLGAGRQLGRITQSRDGADAAKAPF